MSEVENVEATEVVPTIDLSTYTADESIAKVWRKVLAVEPTLVEIRDKVKNSAPPTQLELDQMFAESEDERLVKLRASIERAKASIEKAKKEAYETIMGGIECLSDEELKDLRSQFATSAEEMRTLIGLVKALASTFGYDDVIAAVDAYAVPSLRGVTNGAVGGASSNGDRRQTPRIDSIIVSKDGKVLNSFVNEKGRFGYAATYMRVGSDELRDAWLSAAGATDWRTVKEDVTFNMGDYEVTVTPKA